VAETTVFLKNTLGLAIDGKTAAAIQEKLEGWPVGMRLMAQSLKHSDDLDRLLAGLKGGFATIMDYLVNEVLPQQPTEIAKLMAATATLDQFCAPLCDALHELDAGFDTGKMNGDEFIARLRMDNLFLIALDTEHRWFRYHHLFQQLLQDRLNRYWNPEEIAALHSRANAWFVENNISDDAKIHSPITFRDDGHRTVPEATDHESPSPHPPFSKSRPLPVSPTSRSMVEPLTNRELDVLDLLAQRLSNKEIAEKLFLSTTTVKGHLQNIYGKLNVKKRREAVEKAQALGIFKR
jgi:ATP/maltotriose-dependent transcriptional regulator MalT